jgi:hypothetical protein
MSEDQFMQAHLHRVQMAASETRARNELTRDDARHIRSLAAEQTGILSSLQHRTEGLYVMVRDLLDAALTPDMRQVVDQSQHWRARAHELSVLVASLEAKLGEYRERYGSLGSTDDSQG